MNIMDYVPGEGATYTVTNAVFGKIVREEIPWVSRKTPNPAKGSLMFVNGKPYIHPNIKIKYCDETEQWEMHRDVVRGNLTPSKEGTLRYNPFKTVTYVKENGENKFIVNEEVAYRMNLIPSKCANYFISNNSSKNFQKKHENIQTFGLSINTTHHANERNTTYREINKIYQESKFSVNKRIGQVSRLLNGLTFGVEFETALGSLQTSSLGRLGLVPLVDGSLNSRDQYEYTTVVLGGPKGLAALKESCMRLSSQCKVDGSCALHVHIGSLPKNKEFAVALYQLFYRIQEELFNIVPFYKRHEQSIAGKNKEYSERLIDMGFGENTLYSHKDKVGYNTELVQMYNTLFRFLSCGLGLSRQFNQSTAKNNLPWDRQWHCPTRYTALNFINYFFSTSGTVEFRLHGPTLNFQKTIMWLLICVAIVRYADKYHKKILLGEEKIRLSDIIMEYTTNFGTDNTKESVKVNQEIVESILTYIQLRKRTFLERYTKAIHSTLNGRSNVNTEHYKHATLEFSLDNQELKDIKPIY